MATIVAGLIACLPAAAKAQDTTVLGRRAIPVSSRTLARVAPYVGFLAGAVLADHGFRAIVQDHRGVMGDDMASVGNAFGNPLFMVPVLGLTFAGGTLAHASGVAQAAWHAGRAMLVAGAFTQALKIGVGRARPEFSGNDIDTFTPFTLSDNHNSFPSGHTAVAFSIAAALAEDVHGKWGRRLLYAGATVTAFARVNNDKHWLSDVVGGAMLGTLTAKSLARGHARVAALPGGVGLTLDF
jgi:membrane-associated phospholipid phosphatase